MKLGIRVSGPVVVARIEGDNFINNSNRETLYNEIEKLSLANDRILLDMANVAMVNSAGIGTLVAMHRTVFEAGGKIKFVNIQDKVRTLLEITKLDSLFEIFKTEEEAISSFQ